MKVICFVLSHFTEKYVTWVHDCVQAKCMVLMLNDPLGFYVLHWHFVTSIFMYKATLREYVDKYKYFHSFNFFANSFSYVPTEKLLNGQGYTQVSHSFESKARWN